MDAIMSDQLLITKQGIRAAAIELACYFLKGTAAGQTVSSEQCEAKILAQCQEQPTQQSPQLAIKAFIVFNSGFPQYLASSRDEAEEYVEAHLSHSPEVQISEMTLVEARAAKPVECQACSNCGARENVAHRLCQHCWESAEFDGVECQAQPENGND